MNHLHQIVYDEIKERATPQKAEWWNNYLKGEIPFLGVGTSDIREVFKDFYHKEVSLFYTVGQKGPIEANELIYSNYEFKEIV